MFLPLCQHLRTFPTKLVNGYQRTRCVDCDAEFLRIDPPPGFAPRTLRRYSQQERERDGRIRSVRERMFGE